MTINAASQAFLSYKRNLRRVSASSAEAYRAHLRRFMAAVGRERALGPALGLCEAFVVELSRRGRSDNYVRKAFFVLRDFGTWACSKGYAHSNPLHDMKPPMLHDRQKVFLNREEVSGLLRVMKNSGNRHARRDHALAATLYYTLMRVTEVCRSRPEDYDLETCSVRVFGKGGKARLIPFHPDLKPILREWLKHRPRESPVMFPAQAHLHGPTGVLERARVERILRDQYAAAAGLRGRLTPHTLRRSCADHLRRAHADLKEIQELLRHKSINTTMAYLQVGTPDELRGVWKVMDRKRKGG